MIELISNMSKNTIVCVLGNIGVGKTTFTQHLKQRLPKATLIEEPVDQWLSIKDSVTGENILQRFYQDKKRWSYCFENIAFITRLSRIISTLDDSTVHLTILDGSLATDKNIFAQMLHDDGLIDSLEWQAYNLWNQFYLDHVKQHQIIHFYLHVPPEVALQRIHSRARSEESPIDLVYLQKLDQYYHDWLATLPPESVIICDLSAPEMSDEYNQVIEQVIQRITQSK
jgi:deoxycitidine kinase/deoxyguanosine kinase